MIRTPALVFALALVAAPALAQTPPKQVEVDAYTRYELLAPGSSKFRIVYEVTDATPGATAYFNPIRKGSTASEERVSDRATGKPLAFKVVSGAEARATGLPEADLDTDYIRVALAHPVPAPDGQARVLIEKTYEDAKSYLVEGGDIVFKRSLGVKRNAVVLPAGYRLVSSNYPSQVLQEADGRIKISFWNATPAEAPLVLRARPGGPAAAPSSQAARLDERAHQNRDIVYFLKDPETHAFALYHDYTEGRPGVGVYVNVVRDGSTVTDPSARNLDTGETLPWSVLKGDEITAAKLPADEAPAKVGPQTQVVVFRFRPIEPGGSARLRMAETYTDPDGYKLVGDELVWRRSFGRAADAVVLPRGWVLTNSSIPGTVSETEDGRVRIDFINPRPDEIDVTITARRIR